MSKAITRSLARPTALLTAALTAGALLAGCGQQPSQVGAAAIIGDSTIPLSRVQDRINGILDDDQAARDVLKQHKLDVQARQILSIDIQHKLIQKLAQQVGAKPDNLQVDRLLGEQGGLERVYRNARDQLGVQLFDKATYLQYVRDVVLLGEVGRKLAPKVSISYDQIVSDSKQKAEDYAKRLAADPTNPAGVLAQAQQTGASNVSRDRVRALQAVEEASATPLFGVPQGTVAVYPIGQGTQWATVLVRERRTDLRPDARSDASVSSLRLQDRYALGKQLLVALAYRTKVEPSPRYGVWDPITLEVVPSAGETSGSIIPVRSTDK